MKFQKNFPERVSVLRKERQMTVQMIADKLKIKQQSANAYTCGKSFPNALNLIKLAELFDVSIDYLVGRTDIPKMNMKKNNNENKGGKVK